MEINLTCRGLVRLMDPTGDPNPVGGQALFSLICANHNTRFQAAEDHAPPSVISGGIAERDITHKNRVSAEGLV